MSSADPVLVQFATRHPEDVAEILNGSTAEELVEFLTSLPPDIAAPVVADLSSRQLANSLQRLPRRFIAELLLKAGHADQMTVLSHLPFAAYEGVIDAAPEASQRKLERLLHTPQQTLAAIVTPDFIRAAASMTCSMLRQELEARADVSPMPIFAVDADARFVGIISPMSLLVSANADRRLSDIADRVEPLLGQMSVTSANTSSLWHRHSVLPVVDIQNHLLGAVSFNQIAQADTQVETDAFGVEDTVKLLATSYIEVCASLLDLTFGGERKQ